MENFCYKHFIDDYEDNLKTLSPLSSIKKYLNDKKVNIIGLKNIDCSINEMMIILKNYYLSKKVTVKLFDINEIDNKIYNHKTNIICINPFDISKDILSKFKFKPIVVWLWEFKSLPKIFKEYECYFSKVYTISNFNFDLFSKNLSIPVEKIEIKSQIHNYLDQLKNYTIKNSLINDILNITNGKEKYGYCFDLNSSIIRKNVLNLVKAFQNINDKNKVLILKTRGLRGNTGVLENKIINEVMRIIEESSNIYIINEQINILDLYKLYTYFDYYISPHCGEGYGLTIYDNMILGNKIISPFYSGETDFLDRSKIIELEYEEKEIEELKEHPIYGQMNDYKGAYISVEEISKNIDKYKIPRKIFQTWKTKNLTGSFKLFQESWKRCNPNFEYVIFDDKDCDNYIYNNSKNSKYIDIYNMIKKSGSKADLADFIRYLYIYNEGGIYTDIDTICLQSFDYLYEKYYDKKIIVGLESDLENLEEAFKLNISHNKSLSLHTFISVPNHPIFKIILNNILSNCIDKSSKSHNGKFNNNYGTHVFNNNIYNNLNEYKNDIVILNIETFSNGLWVPHSGCNSLRNNKNSFSCHLYLGTWINKNMKEFNRDKNDPNNYVCKKCGKLNGVIQEWVHKEDAEKYSKNGINSLINYNEKDDELDIYLLTKDNELYLKKYFPIIKQELESHFKVSWNIFENGSKDSTKELLNLYFNPTNQLKEKYSELIKFHNIIYCNDCNSKNKPNYANISLNDYEIEGPFCPENSKYIEYKKKNEKIYDHIGYRCEKLAIAREKIIKLSEEKSPISCYLPYAKWCLLIDSDVVFDYENTIKPLLKAATENPNGVMFCANSQCISELNDNMEEYNKKYHIKYDKHGKKYIDDYYYDTFALEYGKYIWEYNILDTMENLFNDKNVAEVKSAFNGVVLIKKEVLNMSSWSTKHEESKQYKAYKQYGMSEHYHFCEDVRRFGEIYVVKNSIAHWMMDNGYKKETICTVPIAEEKIKEALNNKKLLNNYNII